MSRLYLEVFGYEKPVAPNAIKSDKTLDDYIDLFKSNNLKSVKDWYKYYDNNKEYLLKEGYFKIPSGTLKISQKEFFNHVLNRGFKLELSEGFIKDKIWEYYNLYKKWPNQRSKEISFEDGTTWKNIDDCLKFGYRRLVGKSSLINLVNKIKEKKFGYKNRDLKDYNKLFKDNILTGERDWFEFYDSNKKELLNKGYVKTPWHKFEISQAEFFDYILGRIVKINLSINIIKQKVIEYYILYGKFPTQKSKEISFNDKTSWSAIDQALRYGCRGLSGESSLYKLIEEVKKENNYE